MRALLYRPLLALGWVADTLFAVPEGLLLPRLVGWVLGLAGLAQFFPGVLPVGEALWARLGLGWLLLLAGAGLTALVGHNARVEQAAGLGRSGAVLTMVLSPCLAWLGLWGLERSHGWMEAFLLHDLGAWALAGGRGLRYPAAYLSGGSMMVGLIAAATVVVFGVIFAATVAAKAPRLARGWGILLAAVAAVPYLAWVTVLRARLCPEGAIAVARATDATALDPRRAFAALVTAREGFLLEGVWLGLPAALVAWWWLTSLQRSLSDGDTARLGRLVGRSPLHLLLRDGLGLRDRRALSATLVSAWAYAVVVDVLTQSAVDLFSLSSYPLHPSLGSGLFLFRSGANNVGLDLAEPLFRVGLALGMVLALVPLLLLGAEWPSSVAKARLVGGKLWVGGRKLPALDSTQLASAPSLNFLLGPSGSGKSSWMRAYAAARPLRRLYVPQDPDHALLADFPPGELADAAGAFARAAAALELIGDPELSARLDDPFTPASAYSRGERQRLALAIALGAPRAEQLLLDEPTSALDPERTREVSALFQEFREPGGGAAPPGAWWERLLARLAPSGRRNAPPQVILATHDAELLGGLLGAMDRRRHSGAYDRVFWIGDTQVHGFSVYPPFVGGSFQDGAWRPLSPQSSTELTSDFRSAARRLSTFAARSLSPESSACDSLARDSGARDSSARESSALLPASRELPLTGATTPRAPHRVPLGVPSTLHLGERRLRVPSGLSVAPGTFHLLRGASGIGKSSLLRALLAGRTPNVVFGFLPQDPARAWHERATVWEVSGLPQRINVTQAERLEEAFEGGGRGGGRWEEKKRARFGELSEGQRHRLLFAREFVRLDGIPTDSRGAPAALLCLLLDEPFGAVDPARHIETLRSLYLWIAAAPSHRSAVLITHSIAADRSLLADFQNQERPVSSSNTPHMGPPRVEHWDFCLQERK